MIMTQHEATDFFAMMAGLDVYTNRRFTCVPGLDDIDSMKAANPQLRVQIRTARLANPQILDEVARENPFGWSDQTLEDVRQLRHTISGRFFIERMLKSHAVFLTTKDPTTVYAVGGLSQPIGTIMSGALPVMVDAVLVPWRGRIVWDGLTTALPLSFGPGVRHLLKESYTRAKSRGEIVFTLGQPAATVAKKKAAPKDWRPAVAQILASIEALGRPETPAQVAAFALLAHSARIALATLDGDQDEAFHSLKKADRALQRVGDRLLS